MRRSSGDAAKVAGVLVVLMGILAGCRGGGAPTPTDSSMRRVLTVENRGGPILSVRVNGIEVLQVPCDGAREIEPRLNGVPPLPWTVTVARKRDNVVLASEPIADLPQWYVQVGDASLGFKNEPIQGPAGPAC